MKSASTLLDLAKRCEEATGPDRELDVAIWEAIFGGTDNYLSLIKRSGDWFVRYYPSPPGPEYYRLKSYTASLDAALTLIQDGYAVEGISIWKGCKSRAIVLGCARRSFGKDHKTAWCHSSGDGRWGCEAETPALAICSAALRAHAESLGDAHE